MLVYPTSSSEQISNENILPAGVIRELFLRFEVQLAEAITWESSLFAPTYSWLNWFNPTSSSGRGQGIAESFLWPEF